MLNMYILFQAINDQPEQNTYLINIKPKQSLQIIILAF